MTPLPWRGQLSHIALRTPDVGRASNFYVDHLGMSPSSTDERRSSLGWGIGDPVLDFEAAATAQLDHFAIEIVDPGELRGLASRLTDAGLTVGPVPDDGRHPDGFSVHDPDGRRVEFHGRIDRSGERIASAGARPRRLQHITLATASHDAVRAFYEHTLGMRVSDQMGEVFTWLRCGNEHHTVAVVQSESELLVDHFSFDVDCWDDFREWCDRLGRARVDVDWGPGRHGPGNNLFIMISDPDGQRIELSAEMESFVDAEVDYGPRVWQPGPRSVNLWGSVPPWRAPQVA